MEGKDQELVSLVFACVVVGLEVNYQSLEISLESSVE